MVDILLEKIVSEMLPFKIIYHCFFCRRGSKTAGKCNIYNRIFVDGKDIAKKFDWNVVLTKNSIDNLLICNLMEQLKTKAIVLNLYYMVGEYIRNDIIITENFGEIFFEVANNPFGVYIFNNEINLRVFFNLLKPVTEVIVDKYLSEHCCNKETVSKVKKKELTVCSCLAILKLEVNRSDI